ncbi:hypothetical protein CSW66_26595 [Shigella boydii]|nr:hypothetical protein BFF48_23285 [Shigella sp. FC1882]OEG29967.1 hypothetical protein BHQ33_23340 [Shigella sp. FC2125]OEG41552.1 hypothetical protein BHQ38_23995 [Shigella sp. FC2710]PHU90655.1 hypothetical protein CSW67_25405 [Shigella boydii]PHU93952.1 hypothetical protein CSW66_26595 [Shigella boydii]
MVFHHDNGGCGCAVTDALLVFFRQLAPFVVLPALGIFIIHGTVRQAVGFIVMPERDQALMSLTVI